MNIKEYISDLYKAYKYASFYNRKTCFTKYLC